MLCERTMWVKQINREVAGWIFFVCIAGVHAWPNYIPEQKAKHTTHGCIQTIDDRRTKYGVRQEKIAFASTTKKHKLGMKCVFVYISCVLLCCIVWMCVHFTSSSACCVIIHKIAEYTHLELGLERKTTKKEQRNTNAISEPR